MYILQVTSIFFIPGCPGMIICTSTVQYLFYLFGADVFLPNKLHSGHKSPINLVKIKNIENILQFSGHLGSRNFFGIG
ncbi:hypothetical protein DLD82_16330 [Methanospirillum stamsii]|uniref:Uncharacterized protein n=1 Tax=Methanospirillum stamsii TaxID=1277351 RepID=A0A2V2N4P4_9EURY|nr:hypothetical protein DLD82_16330 [Methanospirillum stamsii]